MLPSSSRYPHFSPTFTGASWKQVNNGLNAAAVISLTAYANPASFGRTDLLASAGRSGAALLRTGDDSWEKINKGLGTTSTVNGLAVKGQLIFAAAGQEGVYVGGGGNAWSKTAKGLENADIRGVAVCGNTVFAWTPVWPRNNLYSSTNDGQSWKQVSYDFGNSYVSVMSGNEKMMFAGTFNGLFCSTDGDKWINIFPGIRVIDLALNGDKIFIKASPIKTTDSSAALDGVFFSADNGISWKQVNHGLPNTNVTCLAVKDSIVFAGTIDGLFYSIDNGENWVNITGNLAGSYIYALVADNQYLYACANGETWKAPLSSILKQ